MVMDTTKWNMVPKINLKTLNGICITMKEIRDGDPVRNLNLTKCEIYEIEINDPHATHCSERCLFVSIEKSKPFRDLK